MINISALTDIAPCLKNNDNKQRKGAVCKTKTRRNVISKKICTRVMQTRQTIQACKHENDDQHDLIQL